MYLEFLVIWVSILIAPVFSFVAFFIIQRRVPVAHLKIVFISAFCLLVFLGCTVLSVSFTNVLANLLCFVIAYLMFCYLVASCWNISIMLLRVLTMLILAVPIGIAYMLGTVGVLGLMFIVGDYTVSPIHTEKQGQNLICTITAWGMAASDSGYTVRLYQNWNVIPFLQRELIAIVVNESAPGTMPSGASCRDVFVAYTSLQKQ